MNIFINDNSCSSRVEDKLWGKRIEESEDPFGAWTLNFGYKREGGVKFLF